MAEPAPETTSQDASPKAIEQEGASERPSPKGPMSIDLAGLGLQSPIILAAGTAGYADEILDVAKPSTLGAVTSKSITAQPREGHPTWRLVPVRGAMLNAIGLANTGIERFAEHVAPTHRLNAHGVSLFASVAGDTIEGYVQVAAQLDGLESIDAVELNVSCPNVHGGADFGVDPPALAELVGHVRGALPSKRLIVKLPPVATGLVGIVQLARAAIEAQGKPDGPNRRPGADILCLCNTMPAMAIDVKTGKPRISNGTGGLSGPAVHAIVVKIIHDVYTSIAREEGVPIIGLGGVTNWEDAAEFVLAGASAIGMGTATMADPTSPTRIHRGLLKWTERMGAIKLSELVGRVRLGV
ncbi:MAG: dihydroorotate dehydrogenase [Phycisphaerales bacterium]|nr:dihydroorotate dehydrogenase [Phycisphaerales bacterium]